MINFGHARFRLRTFCAEQCNCYSRVRIFKCRKRRQITTKESSRVSWAAAVLDVSPEASPKAVRVAYLTRVKDLHPDISGESRSDLNAFLEVREAFEILDNPPGARAERQSTHEKAKEEESFGVPFGHSSSAVSLSNGTLGEQLDSALAMAREGPAIPNFEVMGLDMLVPFTFEAEERVDSSAHDDILQLVSGTQLLGRVRHTHCARISSTSSAEAQSRQTAEEIELIVQGRRVAFGRKLSTREIEIFAVDQGGKHGLQAQLVPSGSESRSSAHRRYAVLNAERDETHALVVSTTPGVRHLHFFQRRGRRGAECRVTNAWRPPTSLWWTCAPRNDTHGQGSWYFELARPRVPQTRAPADDFKAEGAQPRRRARTHSEARREDEAASEGRRVAANISPQTALLWTEDADAMRARRNNGALEPSVYVLAAAFETLRAEEATGGDSENKKRRKGFLELVLGDFRSS